MTTSTSLWGDLDSLEAVRTPTTVLKEQAAALSDATNGVLRGSVEIAQSGTSFVLELSIVAPIMNDYEYKVAVAKHKLDLYPVLVWASWERYEQTKAVECETEEEFLKALGAILGSARVRTVIKSLISQSKS